MKPSNTTKLHMQVFQRNQESESILSLYLRHPSGDPLPAFTPGQYISISPAQNANLASRPCIYSLSDAPSPSHYRISIKRVEDDGAPHCSHYLQDTATVGSFLEVSQPAGSFVLPVNPSPLVFLSAGIGITPVLSMAKHLAAQGLQDRVLFLHATTNSRTLAFASEVEELRQKGVQTTLWFSQPLPTDNKGQNFDFSGRIRLEALTTPLPPAAHYFLCGPPEFLLNLKAQLAELAIPAERIHSESFQPSPEIPPAPVDQPSKVTFARSGVEAKWDGQHPNLLALAEASGLQPAYLCRLGQCGQCEAVVLNGSVAYPEEPLARPRFGGEFICIARPMGDLVLDI